MTALALGMTLAVVLLILWVASRRLPDDGYQDDPREGGWDRVYGYMPDERSKP